MTSEDVSNLVKSAIAGDRRAEEQLFRRLLVRFRIFAAHKIKDGQAVEDVVQEACVVVNQKYKTEQFSVSFEAWAWGVLQTTIKHYHYHMSQERKKESHVDAGLINQTPACPEINVDLERQLTRCLAKVMRVNSLYARALALVYQGYKTAEICERLNVDAGHLYVILYRARSMLRTCLEKGDL